MKVYKGPMVEFGLEVRKNPSLGCLPVCNAGKCSILPSKFDNSPANFKLLDMCAISVLHTCKACSLGLPWDPPSNSAMYMCVFTKHVFPISRNNSLLRWFLRLSSLHIFTLNDYRKMMINLYTACIFARS